MAQLSYPLYQPTAFAGMKADSSEDDIISASAEGVVPFGKFLIRGTNKERQCAVAGTGAGAGALVYGLSVASHTVEQTAADVAQYGDTVTVSVMRRGKLWVETQDAVVAGAVANLHLASGKVTDEAVASGIEAFGQMTVRFVTGTTAAGLAIVEVQPK